MREFIVKSTYYGSNINRYLRKNPNIYHVIPIRPTFFKKEYIAYVGRRWPPGIFLVPLIKIVQAIAVQLGMLANLRTSPYLYHRSRVAR